MISIVNNEWKLVLSNHPFITQKREKQDFWNTTNDTKRKENPISKITFLPTISLIWNETNIWYEIGLATKYWLKAIFAQTSTYPNDR